MRLISLWLARPSLSIFFSFPVKLAAVLSVDSCVSRDRDNNHRFFLVDTSIILFVVMFVVLTVSMIQNLKTMLRSGVVLKVPQVRHKQPTTSAANIGLGF